MPGNLSPWPVIQAGQQGHPVKTLQWLLRARGHSVAVDGDLASKGLPANGIVDPNTWTALIVRVKKGSSGDAVWGVQEEFQFRNGSGDPTQGLQVDGVFGAKTDSTVRGF